MLVNDFDAEHCLALGDLSASPSQQLAVCECGEFCELRSAAPACVSESCRFDGTKVTGWFS